MNGNATIINYNVNAHSIVSAAGRISTTKGGAIELYEKSCNNEEQKNIDLIYKVLSSGHESVLEHIFINLAFDNVSVFVEQFMIEFRLASFTVKSRRYVDFGKMGYYLPDFSQCEEEKKVEEIYRKHMDFLFEEYNYFIQKGIPKEDARFILPYSFKSNFYCTVNARELVKIMNEMVYGRGKEYPELVSIGKSLFSQCEDKMPYLKIEKPYIDSRKIMLEELKDIEMCFNENVKTTEDKLVSLIAGTENPERIICKAVALNCGIVNEVDIKDSKKQKKVISKLLKCGRRRELEQANFTILFNRISLAGVTHLVRHRMQSVVIPDYIKVCNFEEYVLPNSIKEAGLEERYRNVFYKSKEFFENITNKGLYFYDKVYLLLSGMTIPVLTTMNANELYTFLSLRTCNRAQWEIKECGDALLSVLRKKYPVLFSLYGPSCYVTGKCPEGKMNCGLFQEVYKRYCNEEEE